MHRDPQTGQFVAEPTSHYDDIEVATGTKVVRANAGDMDGDTNGSFADGGTFEGVELIDFDELVDRNEALHLLEANHLLVAYLNSTQTADGSVRAAVEISSSPSRQAAAIEGGPGGENVIDDQTGDVTFVTAAEPEFSDSIDLVGRPLYAVAHAPFSDGGTGVGGGGSAGQDRYENVNLPEDIARFHPRDELFLNGILEASNVADAGIHLTAAYQHIYGVVDESC